MAQYTVEAVVLAVHNWGDADKMVTFMTRDRGKIKAAAYGCRRPKNPLAAGMQLFNHLELQLLEGKDWIRSSSIRCKNPFAASAKICWLWPMHPLSQNSCWSFARSANRIRKFLRNFYSSLGLFRCGIRASSLWGQLISCWNTPGRS